MVGARVYEASDIDRAIERVAEGKIVIEPNTCFVNALPDCRSDKIK